MSKDTKKESKRKDSKVKHYPMPKDFFGEDNAEVKIQRQIAKSGRLGGVKIG